MSEGDQFVRIEMLAFEDLAILASMLPIPHINYNVQENVLYVMLAGPSGTGVIYYYKHEGPLKERFIHVDRMTGRVTLGDRASMEPTQTSVVVLRVRSQNVRVT